MGFKEYVLGGQTFCCCLPTRMGVIIMSFLTMLVSLLLAVIIFFEVATSHTMTSHQHAIFVVAGIIEVLLCVTSILGFAGSIAKKLVFVRSYAYFLYFHFLLNFGFATYLLWMISHAANSDVVAACRQIATASTKEQCDGLIKIARNVYLGIAVVLLLIELYGAIIVTRYMRQLSFEKLRDKTTRQSMFTQRHSQMPSEAEHIALLNASAKPTPAAEGPGFNPFEEGMPYRDASTTYGLPVSQTRAEEGYGGGSWRLSEIRAEEKEQVAAQGAPMMDDDAPCRTRPEKVETSMAVPLTLGTSHPAISRHGSDAFAPPTSEPAMLAPPPGSGNRHLPPVIKDVEESFL